MKRKAGRRKTVAVMPDETLEKVKQQASNDPLRFVAVLGEQGYSVSQKEDALLKAFPEIEKSTAKTIAKSWQTTDLGPETKTGKEGKRTSVS